jgi:DNA-binding transcriptional ArsR family regulator
VPNDPLQPDRCASLLSALAAAERLVIVRLLAGTGPMNSGDIAAASGVSLANVSHHLTVLKRAGLVKSERRGRYVRYRVAPKHLDTDAPNGFLNLGCCRLQYPAPQTPPVGPKQSKSSG